MRSAYCLLLALTVLALYAAPAHAGITSWQNTDDPADSVAITNDVFAPSDGGYTWNVGETFLSTGSGMGALNVAAEADTDPRITINKDVTNESSFSWYGYRVDITGTAGYVAGSATTGQAGWSLANEYSLADAAGFELAGLPPVLPGQILSLSFIIDLPPGQFNFQIVQTPVTEPPVSVPAPGALILAAIGATAIPRLRRRTML